MKTMSAREAKNDFALMIDTARAVPALVEKHGCGVVAVAAVEEYELLTGTPTADRRMAHGVKKRSPILLGLNKRNCLSGAVDAHAPRVRP